MDLGTSPLKAVWVGGDQINGLDSPLSYHRESNVPFPKCEMPSETLARIKARQDSLSRMQGVPLGLKPLQHRRWEAAANESSRLTSAVISAQVWPRIPSSQDANCSVPKPLPELGVNYSSIIEKFFIFASQWRIWLPGGWGQLSRYVRPVRPS